MNQDGALDVYGVDRGIFLKIFLSRVINLLLTKHDRDRTGRISAFGLS